MNILNKTCFNFQTKLHIPELLRERLPAELDLEEGLKIPFLLSSPLVGRDPLISSMDTDLFSTSLTVLSGVGDSAPINCNIIIYLTTVNYREALSILEFCSDLLLLKNVKSKYPQIIYIKINLNSHLVFLNIKC